MRNDSVLYESCLHEVSNCLANMGMNDVLTETSRVKSITKVIIQYRPVDFSWRCHILNGPLIVTHNKLQGISLCIFHMLRVR